MTKYPHTPASHPDDQLRPDVRRVERTLHVAWIVWALLVLITEIAVVATAFVVLRSRVTAGQPETAVRWAWFIVAYYILVVPASFFRTGWLFRSYYRYRPVTPQNYLIGMSIVWAALAIGAWLSLAACLTTRTSVPNILLALVGNVMLLVLYPKGNAMAPPAGDPADSGNYEEPR